MNATRLYTYLDGTGTINSEGWLTKVSLSYDGSKIRTDAKPKLKKKRISEGKFSKIRLISSALGPREINFNDITFGNRGTAKIENRKDGRPAMKIYQHQYVAKG